MSTDTPEAPTGHGGNDTSQADPRPLGVGIIGCGQATQALHLPAIAGLADLLRVEHVADASGVVARRVAARLGARSTTDVQELLDDPAVEVVLVATPDAYHARHAVMACRSGKRAVLVEKPLALTSAEARVVVRTSQETGVPVQVGTMHRYDPAFRRAEPVLAATPPELVLIETLVGSNDEFRSDQVQLQRGPVDAADPEGPLALLGAGLVHAGLDAPAGFLAVAVMGLTLSTHDLALLRATLGEPDRIVSVTPLPGIGFEAVLAYGESLAVLIAHENAGRYVDWRFRWLAPHRQVELRFPQSWGASEATVLSVHELADGHLRTETYTARHETGFRAEWRHLHLVATEGVEPLTPASDAAADVALVERIVATGARRAPTRDDALGVAVLGAGWITAIHVPILQAMPDTVVRVVASRTRAAAERRAWSCEADVATFDEIDQIVAREDVDVVLVAGPPTLHAAHAVAALRAGKHVIVEKPLAATLGEADQILAAEAESTGTVAYAENYDFVPSICEAGRLVREGKVGTPLSVRVVMRHPRPSYGSFLDPTWGGGGLFDRGAHAIARALTLSGGRAVSGVSAHLESTTNDEADDLARVVLDLGDGTLAWIELDWRTQDGTETAYAEVSGNEGTLSVALDPRSSLVFGAAGRKDPEKLRWPNPAQGTTSAWVGKYGYAPQLRSFVTALRAGEHPQPEATSGRNVLDVTCAAYHSSGTNGEQVAVPFDGPRDLTPHEILTSAATRR